jgi:uncharacterized protein (DUF2461 family)
MNQFTDVATDYLKSLGSFSISQALEYLKARDFKVDETNKFFFVTRPKHPVDQFDYMTSIDNRDFAVLHCLGALGRTYHAQSDAVNFKVRIAKF